MYKKLFHFVLLIVFTLNVFAQTNPTAQTLPFTFSTQTGSTLPAGIAVHKFGTTVAAIPTARTLTPGTTDLAYQATANAGGWNDQGAKGIGILASGSNSAGAMIVAINTTGKTTITTGWKITTILNQTSRDNSIALQYRVGTTGDFIDIGTTSTYNSTGKAINDSTNYSETLPVGAENQAVVQVRWIYWESSGTTGSRDRLAISNINISGTATTPAPTPSPSPCITPVEQATALVFTAVNSVSITASFTAPAVAPNEYIVVMSSNTALSSAPVDGIVYNIGDGLGDGTVVARSNALSFTAAALSPSSTYYFFIYSLNSACTGGPKYLTLIAPLNGSATTSAGVSACVAPATQPTNLTFNNVTVNTINGSFTAAAANEYIVVQSTTSTLSANPINGVIYNAGDIIGNGKVIARNANTIFTAGSLTANTTYHYFIFSINSLNCSGGPKYNTVSPLHNSQTTQALPACTTPSAQPINLILTPSNSAISINYDAVNGSDNYLIVKSVSSTLSANPVNNQDYTAGDNIGGGSVIAITSFTGIVASNLTPATTYYFFIFSLNKDCTGGTKYLVSQPLSGSATTSGTALNNVYFGTLHSHSDYSDGNKDNAGYTPADDYKYAMTANCLDYLGISEHNHFSSANNPGNTIDLYHRGSIQADSFTVANPNFLALYGMEWGTISGGGHVVIYGDKMDKLFGWETGVGGNTGNNYDVFVAKGDYTGTSGLFKVVNDNIATNTFATLAHPNSADYNSMASTFSTVADDAVVGAAVESGPAFSTSQTYNDPASSLSFLSYFTTLLSKGYHVGPTVDHDNHNTTFGHTTTSRTAIIAPNLSKTEIVKAMKNMHFYATQDCDTKVDFTINTKMMGSIFSNSKAPIIAINITDATTSLTNAVIKIMGGTPGSGVAPTQIYTATGSSLNYTDLTLANLATGYYYADITNGSSRIITSPIWYTRLDNTTLPVTLKLFDVQKLNSSVKVFWTTAQEINSSYFIVQHSADGISWSDISKQNAAGESLGIANYQMVDNAPAPGINFYRLKQVDKDGKATMSAIKSIEFVIGNEVFITPNPATDKINIYFANSNNSISKISIYQSNGVMVKEFTTTQKSVQVNISAFARGMYIVKILNGLNVITKKVMVN